MSTSTSFSTVIQESTAALLPPLPTSLKAFTSSASAKKNTDMTNNNNNTNNTILGENASVKSHDGDQNIELKKTLKSKSKVQLFFFLSSFHLIVFDFRKLKNSIKNVSTSKNNVPL
jgi:hypothetical protein